MSGSSTRLVVASGVMIRPVEGGCLVVVGDEPPRVVGQLHERILAACLRPTERSELHDLVDEASAHDRSELVEAIDGLLAIGALVEMAER